MTPAENESKGDRFPAAWLASSFPDENDCAAIRALHHLGDVDDDLDNFEDFFTSRRERLAAVVRRRLGVLIQPRPLLLPSLDSGFLHY